MSSHPAVKDSSDTAYGAVLNFVFRALLCAVPDNFEEINQDADLGLPSCPSVGRCTSSHRLQSLDLGPGNLLREDLNCHCRAITSF